MNMNGEIWDGWQKGLVVDGILHKSIVIDIDLSEMNRKKSDGN
jgi:hypothetical protein